MLGILDGYEYVGVLQCAWVYRTYCKAHIYLFTGASMSQQSTQIAVQSFDNAVTFTTKKGLNQSISAEGALFKGGEALKALKDVAMSLALSKAVNGRFAPAADILASAFPKALKAFDSCFGKAPSTDKRHFAAFLITVQNQKAPEKGWSKKQAEARLLLNALDQVINPAPVTGDVVAEPH